MIPYGVTPVDSQFIADLRGISLVTLRRHKPWDQLPPTLSRPGAKQRLWAKDQILAAEQGLPIPPLPRQLAPQEMTEEQRAAVQAGQCAPTTPHPDDLLDAWESRLVVPEERRPTWSTWQSYLFRITGPQANEGPEARPQDNFFGVQHYRRAAVEKWAAERRRPGGGPGRQGAPDKNGRVLKAERWTIAKERLQRTAELLDARPDLRPVDLAPELDISAEHAGRLLAQVRAERGAA